VRRILAQHRHESIAHELRNNGGVQASTHTCDVQLTWKKPCACKKPFAVEHAWRRSIFLDSMMPDCYNYEAIVEVTRKMTWRSRHRRQFVGVILWRQKPAAEVYGAAGQWRVSSTSLSQGGENPVFPHAQAIYIVQHGLRRSLFSSRRATDSRAARIHRQIMSCPNHVTTALGAWQNEYCSAEVTGADSVRKDYSKPWIKAARSNGPSGPSPKTTASGRLALLR